MGSATAHAATASRDDLVLGRYRLDRRLGAGAYGTVYEARDVRLDRDVAVKVVGLEPGGGRARREVLAAARLAHPAIVTLYEAGDDGEDAYLVSELVRGRTLSALMGEGLLSDRDVARIGAALCDALAHAHAHGVVHRDVKPQNVIVPDRPETGAGIVKLTDFGVARLAGSEPLTRTGNVVGTLAYMAPEQAEGLQAGPEADLYSLALVLFEGFGGRNPVRAATPAATARRLGSRLPSLARDRPDLPEPLVVALDRALDPDPELRGATADLRGALADAAPELADEPGLVGAPRRAWAIAPAGPARLAAAAAAAGLVGAGIAGLSPVAPPGGAFAWAAATAPAVALLPRAGWLAAAAALVAWLAAGAGLPGSALVVAVGLAPVPLLLPRAGLLWSIPAAAPALGAAGLAGAQPGIAGVAASAARRASLAALGFLWVALAELLTGTRLYLGPVPGAAPAADWRGDAAAAVTGALAPLAASGLLAVAVVWALAAAALPALVRGRRPVVDVVLASAWAGATAAGAALVARAAMGAGAAPQPRGAVAGALAGAALAVAWRRRERLAEPGLEARAPGADGDALP
ncbi:MAG: serine/threonine-protein kinase [Solirubrobacteraceae bacterium]